MGKIIKFPTTVGTGDPTPPNGIRRPMPPISGRNHPSMGKSFDSKMAAGSFEPFEATEDSDPTPPHGMARPKQFTVIQGEKE